MKVFIREYCRDVTIRIFGLDGEERTKEFFDKHFFDVRGVGKMSDEDRKENLSEAEITLQRQSSLSFLLRILETFRKLSI